MICPKLLTVLVHHPNITENLTESNLCKESDTGISNNPDSTQVSSIDVWANVKHKNECESTFAEMKDLASGLYDDIESDLRYVRTRLIQDKYVLYRQIINGIFANSTFNLSSVELHRECLDIEGNMTYLDDLFIDITELGANLSLATTYHEAYQYAVQIPPLYRKRIQYNETQFYNTYNDARKACSWLESYGEETRQEGNKHMRDFGIIRDFKDTAVRKLNKMTKLFNRIYVEVTHKIEPIVKLGAEYLNKTITKLMLAEKLDTAFFTKAVQDLEDIYEDLVDINKDYSEDMIKGKNKVVALYNKLLNLKLPILNESSIYDLELVKSAGLINDKHMQELVDSLNMDINVKLSELITETYKRLMDPLDGMTEPVNELIGDVDNLAESLKEYKTSTKMNTEFFM